MFVKKVVVTPKKYDTKALSPEVAAKLPGGKLPLSNFVEITLESMNIAAANALRRVISDEVPVKALNCNMNDIITTDVFIVRDFVQDRLRQIRISQDVDDDCRFKLEVVNNTPIIKVVTTKDLIPLTKTKAEDIMYDTIPIIELNPGKSIVIKAITIDKGYNWQYGGYKVATNVALVPLDQKMFDPYINDKDPGVKAGLADPRKHRLTFCTEGNIQINKLLTLACDEILLRLERVLKELDSNFYTIDMKSGGVKEDKNTGFVRGDAPYEDKNTGLSKGEDSYEDGNIREIRNIGFLEIKNENVTIGALITKTIDDLFDDIRGVKYEDNPINRRLTIVTEAAANKGSGKKEIGIAAEECIKQFKKIREEFMRVK